jgi:CBS domain-containing protein
MVPVSAAADDAPTVEETATLRSALALILERGVPAVRVVRADGTVAGMVTIADIVARFGKALA